ncbi:MAG: DUF59 domain-containing protein [Actinobacteria bacterium]|nr:DUF59 domain-containing protein [Actinomycetota bacterium]
MSRPVEVAYEALRGVLDPELGLDVVALGLIYDVRLQADGLVVEMTLTTPGCPVAESLPFEAEQAVREALGPDWTDGVSVHVVWDPPWTPERIEAGVLP